jgi:hypothetical protein
VITGDVLTELKSLKSMSKIVLVEFQYILLRIVLPERVSIIFNIIVEKSGFPDCWKISKTSVLKNFKCPVIAV